MQRIAIFIDCLNEVVGRLMSWLALLMVVMMATNVLMRYAFSAGMPWQQEIVRFGHGMLFLGGAAYALKHEALVRVDVLYQGMCERKQAWVNIIGTFLFLWPVCFALTYFSADFVINSWKILEGSPEYMGMPGVFVFKSFIWVAGGLLALQGLAQVVHSVNVLCGKEHVPKEEVSV